MIQMTLSKGHVATLDDEDADLTRWRWKSFKGGIRQTKWCAIRCVSLPLQPGQLRRKTKTLYLHRVIAERMGLEIEGRSVDHINGDSLDNRRANLRAVTQAENSKNWGLPKNNTSGHRGVVRDTRRPHLWRAQICTNGHSQNLGSFQTKEEAIARRLEAEREQWGIQPRRAAAHAS